MVEDIRKVLHWTGENADRLGGEPSSIYLMGHGSGSHLSLLTVVQEAVVRSRDAYWLSSYTKAQKQAQQNGYSSSEGMSEDGSSSNKGTDPRLSGDSRIELHHHSVAGQGEVEISAGIRRLEIFGGEAVQVPRIKGMVLMAGVGDVIKHVRMEAKNGIEQISPLRRALGPSHASCLMASPSHLLFGAKQVSPLHNFRHVCLQQADEVHCRSSTRTSCRAIFSSSTEGWTAAFPLFRRS